MCVTCMDTRFMAEAHFTCMTSWGLELQVAPRPLRLQEPCGCKAGSFRCPYSYGKDGALVGARCKSSLTALGDLLLCPIPDDVLVHNLTVGRAPPFPLSLWTGRRMGLP